jgi:ADP-ribose pyrophosphatase YjhB (NUDIX family)
MKPIRAGLFRILYRAAFEARALLWEIQKPTLIGVRALVVQEEQVLLIRHRSGAKPWSLPGGGVERHERMAEAARREVYEEAGLPVHADYLLGVYDAFRGELVNYIMVFVCSPQGPLNPPESIEIAEARYFPLTALPNGIDDGSKRRVAEYLAGERGVSALW